MHIIDAPDILDAEFCASQAPYIRNRVWPGQILQLTWTSQRWAGEPDYVWPDCPREGRPMLPHVLLVASPRPARTKRPWRVMTTQWPIFFNNATFQTPGQPSSSDSRLYWTNFFELSWRKFSPSDSRANTLGGASLRPPTGWHRKHKDLDKPALLAWSLLQIWLASDF